MVTETTLSNTGYYSNNFLKRALEQTVFTSERLFSFNFNANLTTDTSSSTFTLDYGTSVDIVLNVTNTDANSSCILEELATALGVNSSVFALVNDINSTQIGVQNLTILILESSSNSSESLANAVVEYLSNNTLSCGNTTVLIVNETVPEPATLSFQLRVVSSSFNSVSLSLVLQFSLRVTSPLIGNSTSFSVNSTITPTTQIGASTCDSQFCQQAITLTYDLSSLDCTGITENAKLQMEVACADGTSSSLCNFYMNLLNGRLIEIPYSVSAEWCPKTETTQISTQHFHLSSAGTQLSNGDSLNSSRTIDGEILVNVDSVVTGTSLSSASISQLILSDGTTPYLIASNEFSGNYTDATSTITFQFTHQIDPAQIPLNFSNPLIYIATIQVSFLPSSNKKQIGRATNENTITLKLQSTTFKLFPSSTNDNNKTPSSTPSSDPSDPSQPPSTSSSNKTLPIVIAVVASICGIAIIALIVVVLRRKSKSQKGRFAKHKDEDIPL